MSESDLGSCPRCLGAHEGPHACVATWTLILSARAERAAALQLLADARRALDAVDQDAADFRTLWPLIATAPHRCPGIPHPASCLACASAEIRARRAGGGK